jgi:hypothetical protein
MKIGLYNFGGGEQTLGLSIIYSKLKDAQKDVVFINPQNDFNPRDYDILCFSLFWWENKYDYIRFLKNYGINPDKRKPMLVLGGMEMLNPVPMQNFFHYAVMGDGENIIVPLVEAIENNAEPTVDGVFVPGAGKTINIQQAKMEPKQYIDLRVSKQTRIEIARGCKNACLFCLLRWIKPYQEINGEALRYLIQTATTKNVALFCADRGSHSDHDNIQVWCKKYGKRNTGTDLRIDSTYKYNIIDALRFGIESFSERNRKAIGKNYTNENLLEYFKHIFYDVKTSKGKPLTTATMYVILGLPGETGDDIDEFCELLQNIDKILKYKFTLFLTFNTFSPYFFTPLQWAPVDIFTDWNKVFASKYKRLGNIVTAKRGGFRSPASQLKHLLTLRGDDRAYRAIYHIATTPGIDNAMNKNVNIMRNILKKCNIDMEELYGEIPAEKNMPYDFIKNKVSKDAMLKMWERYKNATTT